MYFLSEILGFRNVHFYRIRGGNLAARMAKRAVGLIYRTRESLYFDTEEGIGPGPYIEHGFSMMIAAKRIGANA